MTARRSHGDGSIYQDNRGRWIAVISTGHNAQGKRTRRKRVARTKTAARAKLRELQQDLQDGVAIDGTNVTVGYLLERVVDNARNKGRQPKTIENYQWAIGHLSPALGQQKARDLTPFEIERFLQHAKSEHDLSRSSLIRLRGVLKSALTEAERHSWVRRNAAALAQVPDSHTTDRRALTVKETRLLIETAGGTRIEAAVIIGLTCGLRPGEILGLTWSDIDLDADSPAIHIRHALKQDKTGTYLGEVKTKTSRRSLGLSNVAADAIRRQRRTQNTERLVAGQIWNNHDLVFATRTGSHISRHNFNRDFKKLTTKTGLGALPPYTMRHTAITLLSEANVPAELIADLAGHQDTRTLLNVYRHTTGSLVEVGAAEMDRLLGGRR